MTGYQQNGQIDNGVNPFVHQDAAALVRPVMLGVFNWMGLGLVLTALCALSVTAYPPLGELIFSNPIIFYGLIIGELILVIALSMGINKMSSGVALTMFFVYAGVNGLTLSVIFLAYTMTSIVSTFLITAATFGAMSLYGYTTKKDLTGWGSFLLMGLFGLIIASIVNMFMASSGLSWVISIAGVLIFVGLTAYDTQKIKGMLFLSYGDEEATKKVAVMGALSLYLDFINIFLYLLRFMGKKR